MSHVDCVFAVYFDGQAQALRSKIAEASMQLRSLEYFAGRDTQRKPSAAIRGRVNKGAVQEDALVITGSVKRGTAWKCPLRELGFDRFILQLGLTSVAILAQAI